MELRSLTYQENKRNYSGQFEVVDEKQGRVQAELVGSRGQVLPVAIGVRQKSQPRRDPKDGIA